ncbi:putative membrane protein [Rubidibacter lacunae KORDI 51-2]|uniref:Putative membrane protein n=1 Tax=Rubidibacter lacunae KORDI 51-2 TaxID=582515 RepID=U5DPI2_9CHRO|nr:rhomboid family intramembrane serine protease [Rubidibacter lacunae]ERN42767.1 putative membrane protein [Rubidibacter lacunae KORDI 51-2]
MTLNAILLLLSSLSCGSLLMQTLSARQNRGWSGVSAAILGAIAATLAIAPGAAGLVGGGLWLTFVVVPLVGKQGVSSLMRRERFREARWLSARLAWLHPADGWPDQPRLLRALELGQRGQLDRAAQLLDPYRSRPSGFGYAAATLLYRIEARWDELLQWMDESLPSALRRTQPTLTLVYLRALGETGKLDSLLWQLTTSAKLLARAGNSINLHQARLYAVAFCGREDLVRRLFAGPLAGSSLSTRSFWLATAAMAAGDRRAGSQQLRQLYAGNSSTLDRAIDWRLRHPPALATALNPAVRQILARLEDDFVQESRYADAVTPTFKLAPLTLALIGLNMAVFGLEAWLGGTQDRAVLYRLGALVPSVVVAGEWWRLLSANFLHYGPLHLGGNLLGLWLFGPYVERAFGFGRALVVYFTSGVGAMLLFVLLALQFGDRDSFLVGASAAIMGTIGATVAILWRGWRRDKSRLAGKRLRLVCFIIGAQMLFDIAVPQVSFLGHLLGLMLGYFSSLLLLRRWEFRDDREG